MRRVQHKGDDVDAEAGRGVSQLQGKLHNHARFWKSLLAAITLASGNHYLLQSRSIL
jgi:hypothetical protein